jgi:hypothetical protein
MDEDDQLACPWARAGRRVSTKNSNAVFFFLIVLGGGCRRKTRMPFFFPDCDEQSMGPVHCYGLPKACQLVALHCLSKLSYEGAISHNVDQLAGSGQKGL